ncbi:MAG: HypC/HybG/HupF family hydrogenase formation chaperone [Thiogranum sp.]
MCLAIPMKITAIDGFNARCEAKGVERDVSLFMMQNDTVEVGDFVMVHVGYAIQKMTPQDARSAWEVFDEVLGTADIPLTAGDEHV